MITSIAFVPQISARNHIITNTDLCPDLINALSHYVDIIYRHHVIDNET